MTCRFTRLPVLAACAALPLALVACQPTAENQAADAAQNGAESRTPQQLVSSEYDVVLAMLNLAGVNSDDLVVDLGSGDGRIPILAAREKGARGLGIEINRNRIRQSTENARKADVGDRVEFRQQDLFVTPLNDATVLTLYLLPEINMQLRPKILSQMKPGTRVVSNSFDMGDWGPDQKQMIGGTNIFMWVIPAKVDGRWRFTQGGNSTELFLEQRYQVISGTAGNARLTEGQLRGDQIAFTADLGQGSRRYQGRVEGGRMAGDGWQAVRIDEP